jgi:hypothetical protein
MGIETALLVSAAVSAGSAVVQGVQANKMGKYQQAQAQADADAAAASARLEAGNIRKAGERQRSAARAALAASGVNVDEGTAELINTEITQNAEQDALTTIQTGGNRARMINAEGDLARIQGRNAQTAGILSAGSTALSAGATYGRSRGWRA